MSRLFRHSIILTLAIFLVFPLCTAAQHPDFVPAPAAIKNAYENRKEKIDRELANLKDNDWAGDYWAEMGPIDGALLHWSPVSGFTVRSGNDFHRGVERINYGDVRFSGDLLTVSPTYQVMGQHVYPIANSFVPVKWGQQRWLIPSNELLLFIYAVNAGDYGEINTFFVKDEDSQKESHGLPIVPPEYRKYLNKKPIRAKVIKIETENEPYYNYTFTINAGKDKGVIEHMKFYLVNVKNVIAKIEITRVAESTAIARAVSIGRSGDYEKEIKPSIGWTFSSKSPTRLF